jgi:hypothetical protein
MSIKRSTGFCNKALVHQVAVSTAALFGTVAAPTVNAMNLRLYGGSVPPTADAAASTLLCTITGPTAAALLWDTANVGVASPGLLQKDPAQTWAGVVTGAGTQNATYFRFVASDDTDALSTTYPRVQGVIGLAGVELDMSSVSQVNGATTTINSAALAMIPS